VCIDKTGDPAINRSPQTFYVKSPPGATDPVINYPSLMELCHSYRVSKVTASSALAVLDQQGIIAVRHGLRAVVQAPRPLQDEDAEIARICQQVSAMTRRQEQIVEQVQSLLDNTLCRLQQQVRQLQQQVHQLRL
jgi:DNA-binding GntR family transcriptional regulator